MREVISHMGNYQNNLRNPSTLVTLFRNSTTLKFYKINKKHNNNKYFTIFEKSTSFFTIEYALIGYILFFTQKMLLLFSITLSPRSCSYHFLTAVTVPVMLASVFDSTTTTIFISKRSIARLSL